MPKSHEQATSWYANAMRYQKALHDKNLVLQTKLDNALREIERLKKVIQKGAAFLAAEVDKGKSIL